MSFYVTLPSNTSPKIFPDNKPSHFFVKLPQTIDVSSHYEVGLVEIQFPNSYCNILEDEVWVQYYDPPKEVGHEKSSIQLTLPPGLYNSIDHIVDELNRLIVEMENAGEVKKSLTTRLFFVKKSMKTGLMVYHLGAEVRISEKLKNILGFNSSHATDANAKLTGLGTEEELDNNEITVVYVYCDLVTARPVGDVMVPLLRTVPIMDRSSMSVFRVYDKPHYVALSRFSFDTVEILLTNGMGQTIPFTRGTSVVTLHFRTRKHFDLD
jgi:hypothetical protein